MKKILAFVFLFTFLFVLASCGSKKATDSSEQTAQTSDATAAFDVKPTVEKFEIYYSDDMIVGTEQKIDVDIVLSGAWPDIAPEKRFESSDESVLTVDEYGVVRAIAPGTATVTVRERTIEKSVEITVCAAPVPLTPTTNPNDIICYKPVIYLCPAEPTDVTVKFGKPENLLTTYPKYNGAWRVHADACGTLTDANGRQYYALFFDETRTHDVDFSSGFYVTADDAIPFLEEKLALLGFTEREADEFIMFWLPVLEKNGQSVVYFEQTEEREAECPLVVSPSPDSTLRVIIHIKKVDAPVEIAPQTIVPFERRGFTLVEWGGTTY